MQPLNFIPIAEPQASDLNRQSGINAYRNMSWTPEKRADGDIASYIAEVEALAAQLSTYAVLEAQKIAAAEQLERFRLAYISWETTLWAAKARTASPMITGTANFPVERNRKRMEAEMKKVGAFLEWLPKAKAAALRIVKEAGEPPKEINTTPAESLKIGDVEIVTNYEAERIQILFPGKPTPEIIAELKGAAWKWSPRNSAWQRFITPASMRSAKQIAEKANA